MNNYYKWHVGDLTAVFGCLCLLFYAAFPLASHQPQAIRNLARQELLPLKDGPKFPETKNDSPDPKNWSNPPENWGTLLKPKHPYTCFLARDVFYPQASPSSSPQFISPASSTSTTLKYAYIHSKPLIQPMLTLHQIVPSFYLF